MNTINPPVIYYHSIAPDLFQGWVLDWMTMKLRFFEDQMAYLQEHNYQSIFLDEWLLYRQRKKSPSGNEVCLTMDDGLLDNWVYAFPMAKKYRQKLTLFISPECVDPRDIVRPNLDDVWSGEIEQKELEARGYMSWNEIKLMEEAGYVDGQSHTMTHAKYVKSSKLTGYYYGGHKGLHTILNANPSMRPYYIADADFESRLPLGTPIFEETSSVVTKRHFINPDYVQEVTSLAKNYDFSDIGQRVVFEKQAQRIHQAYAGIDNLLAYVEEEEDFQRRLNYEIVKSKEIIEEKLNKSVGFMSWPYDDSSHQAHRMAKENGYLATTSGKMYSEQNKEDRIPRFEASTFRNNLWLSRQKFNYKICSHFHKQPYYAIWLANSFKNKVMNKSHH
ncbi:MAG: polysaccharide deacetylase family protein [Saprospiraceae bacterium]|nr:polysaccharide deacetylase family protein [Saprospiraceae bacterium]